MNPNDLIDNEAVMDSALEGGTPAPEPDAPAEGDAPLAPTAETAPEAPETPWRDDPELLDRFAEITQAQLDQRIQQQPTAQGDEPDWNERLNALDDNFGTNLAQFIRSELQSALAPVTERATAEDASKADAQVATMIDDAVTKAGGFPADVADDAKALIRMIAPTFGDEMVGRYGQTDRAAEAILAKATQTVQSLLAKATKTGGQGAIDQLAAVRDAHTTLTGQGSAMSVPGQAKSPRELFERTFGIRQN